MSSNYTSPFPVQGHLTTIDPLQQIYTIDSLQTLRKYDKTGQLLFEYNNRNLGAIQHCDASDPLGVLLFYPDFNTIILLDRTLNPLAEVRLEELGIFGAQAVATSLDKQIWVYDQQDFRLKKISRQGRLLQESADLSRWINNGFRAEQLVIQNEAIFLQAEGQLLVFNPFGQYLKTLPIAADRFLYQLDRFYYFADQKGQYIWEPIRGKIKYLIQPENATQALAARPQFTAVQHGSDIEWYTF